MKNLLACVLVTAALVCAWCNAETLPAASPESVGMSSERLDRIGDAIGREIEEGRMPGAVLAIARHGKLVYYEAFGFMDIAAGTPMQRDAIFSIASLTKPIVAVGALTLFEQGRLLMHEPIGVYVPELVKKTVAIDYDPFRTMPATRQPTVEDLFRHTSGFTNPSQGDTALHRLYPSGNRATQFTSAEYIDALAKVPLHHQPGTTWDYSLGFDILGVIIERISGQTHGEYLRENIFAPLSMNDTFFTIPRSKAGRHVKPLPKDPTTGEPQSQRDHSAVRFECGGGCLASTALDYLTFAQMLLNGGELNGQRILGPETVAYMTADHAGPDIDLTRLHNYPSLPDDGYGFGLGVSVRRGTGLGGTMAAPGEYHWYGATGTVFRVDPQQDLAIVFMAHTPGEIRRVNRQLIPTLVYQAIID